jgi:uncharacterized membrane protein YuzA (DUF378 family)
MRTDTDRNAMDIVAKILIVLAAIGAINWGLIGFFNFNVVDAIFGGGRVEETSTASRVVYAIVGLSGLVSLGFLPKLHAATSRRLRAAT